MSGIHSLTLFQCTSAQFAVARSCYHTVREVELCHLQRSLSALNGSSCILFACLHLVNARVGSLLLAAYGVEFLLRSVVFGFNLFELYRCGGIASHEVLIALAVLVEFGKTYFNLGYRSLVHSSRGLSGLQRSVYNVGSSHCVLQCSLCLHYTDAIFAVVENKQRVALLHVLMFLEVYFLDISRSTHVHWRYVLLYLGVVTLLVALVVHKHAGYLHDAPYQYSHADEAYCYLADALALKLLGS